MAVMRGINFFIVRRRSILSNVASTATAGVPLLNASHPERFAFVEIGWEFFNRTIMLLYRNLSLPISGHHSRTYIVGNWGCNCYGGAEPN